MNAVTVFLSMATEIFEWFFGKEKHESYAYTSKITKKTNKNPLRQKHIKT